MNLVFIFLANILSMYLQLENWIFRKNRIKNNNTKTFRETKFWRVILMVSKDYMKEMNLLSIFSPYVNA